MANEILTLAQIYAADHAAMQAGIPGTLLMERAGMAVAQEAITLCGGRPVPVAVLCGPGNNGGDGFVAARHLAVAGWPVRVGLLGDRETLRGDAAWAAGTWTGVVEAATPDLLTGAGLVIDALFGAGLNRPMDGPALTLVQAMAEQGAPVLAVDVPSGVSGDDGAILGGAPVAEVTVSFFRPKPAHYLYPARAHIGRLVITDIGIPEVMLDEIAPSIAVNSPALWRAGFPRPMATSHKYQRGHALIL